MRASKIVGLTTVPAYIRIANDQESLEMALVENIQRHDLDPIEIALSYQRLIDEIQLTQEQMSDACREETFYDCELFALLKLDPIIQTGIRDGFISMGHGRAIINIDDQDVQTDIYQKIVAKTFRFVKPKRLVKNYHRQSQNRAGKSTKRNSFCDF